ncbi:mechanosensitive ion channel domain-containing protein [Planktothricoides raciborskii]|uniref:Mechanosensitive ion channel domain-containing protein n=1 Tax=Planktothricoides raciborskii GIHE-MW2 TaxID=2792601 RepID=A0AAU8JI35_9CYAN
MISSAILIKLLVPTGLILAGLIGGIIFEKRIVSQVKKILIQRGVKFNRFLTDSVRGIPFLIFFVAGIYAALISSSLGPKWQSFLSQLILIIILGYTTLFFSKIAIGFIRLYSQTAEGFLPLTSLFENLTRLLIFIIGFLIILQSLGISITPLLTALGVGGISVGLALQSTLSNIFCGINLIMSRKVNPGDYVKLETGEEGYVTDVTWRHTTIREYPNNLIIVPNAELVASTFKNYHLPEKTMLILVEVGVSYDSDLEKVERVTLEVAKEIMRDVPGGVSNFKPFIRYHSFGYFSINFTVYMEVKEFIDHLLIKHEFIKKLFKRYQIEGITIPYPIKPVYNPETSQNKPKSPFDF